MHIIRKVEDAKPEKIICGILRNLTTAEDSKEFDLAHITITDSTENHFHKRITEVYYVLKGSIDVEIDKKTVHLEVGEMILIHPNTNHKATKGSSEDAEILAICSPPWSEDDENLV